LLKFLNRIKNSLWDKEYFSQEGEDFYISKIIDTKKPGYYLDVGSADPIRASNTYWFYLRGWRGLCVDASPGLIQLYQKLRPLDIFFNAFVGKGRREREFYLFNEPLLNTGSNLRKDYLEKNTDYKLQKKILIQEFSLREILELNLPKGKRIDFMSLDVEDGELEVLQSNDWSSYRPRLIVMEVLNPDRELIGESTSTQYLKKMGYRVAAILPRSVFFIDS
jgi:hypothetical protein